MVFCQFPIATAIYFKLRETSRCRRQSISKRYWATVGFSESSLKLPLQECDISLRSKIPRKAVQTNGDAVSTGQHADNHNRPIKYNINCIMTGYPESTYGRGIVRVAKKRRENCPGGKKTVRKLSGWQKNGERNCPGGKRMVGNCPGLQKMGVKLSGW